MNDCISALTFLVFITKLLYSLKVSYLFSVHLINNAVPLSTSHRLPKTCWVFEFLNNLTPAVTGFGLQWSQTRSPGIFQALFQLDWGDSTRTRHLKICIYNSPATTTKIQDIFAWQLCTVDHPSLVGLWYEVKWQNDFSGMLVKLPSWQAG